MRRAPAASLCAASVYVAVDAVATGRESTTAASPTRRVKKEDVWRAVVGVTATVTLLLVGRRRPRCALRLLDYWNGHRRWVGGHACRTGCCTR